MPNKFYHTTRLWQWNGKTHLTSLHHGVPQIRATQKSKPFWKIAICILTKLNGTIKLTTWSVKRNSYAWTIVFWIGLDYYMRIVKLLIFFTKYLENHQESKRQRGQHYIHQPITVIVPFLCKINMDGLYYLLLIWWST